MHPPFPRILSWPLGGISDGRYDWSQDERSVREVLLNILLTRPGERLMRPDFGAGLAGFVHQPNNETTRNLIAGVVRKAIARHEPRVVVEDVEVSPARGNVAEVHVRIRYRLRHSPLASELELSIGAGR
ncbi:GPW/gp25 family protein [Halomonas sp. BM-2019]|uniref:GPW/gp25 family protein n=1 Tax=Halomonas sp. BM-2019 TaxID=2811227 RepID=UPI001B3C2D0A|nr:MAG: GPW/gp25 family protein [Halomonas sp. BM-2019]